MGPLGPSGPVGMIGQVGLVGPLWPVGPLRVHLCVTNIIMRNKEVSLIGYQIKTEFSVFIFLGQGKGINLKDEV